MPITFPVRVETVKFSNGPNQTIFYPQVTGMENKQLQRAMNQTIAYQTRQLIQQQTEGAPAVVEEMIGFYELKNNQRQVFSVALSNYTYYHHAAHGMTYLKSLTFDLQQGTLCQLKDLFKPGSDYVKRLSDLIRVQITRRHIPLLDGFTAIKPNQDFYIADKALVVYFQLYEIAPYAAGFPMFPISVFDLQDIIKEDGPLGRMAIND